MMPHLVGPPRPFSMRTLAGLLLLAAFVYAVTEIPHVLAFVHAPAGTTFGGALAWGPDQDCYFSFVRQSADGHWLFINRLTSIDHAPAYFNLEWLLVGRVMALFDHSTVWAYHIWRAFGAISVVCGLYALTRVAFVDRRLAFIAMVLGVFGGTFRWVALGYNELSSGAESLFGWHLGALSTEFGYFAAHPFAQVMTNPHFAGPLGIFMLAIAAFLKGEKTGSRRWYVISGVLAAIEATMRPYEMIVLYTAIPAFALVEIVRERKIDRAQLGRRMLPLAIVAPVFAYTIYIFEVHPIFKYWASQGVDEPTPIGATLAHLGLGGALFALRMMFVKKFPLSSPIERMLLAWLAAVFFFIHANTIPFLRFMPYTPQLITSLMPSIILLGVPVLDPGRWRWSSAHPRIWIALLIAMFSLEAIDDAALAANLTPHGSPDDVQLYIPSSEIEAYAWLAREANEEDVVLGAGRTGHRVAKFASVRVVSGHWSVTPNADRMEVLAERFYRDKMSVAQAAAFLADSRVNWVYFGPGERRTAEHLMQSIPGFARHVVNTDVTIYGPRR
jgi:hypothetical protein